MNSTTDGQAPPQGQAIVLTAETIQQIISASVNTAVQSIAATMNNGNAGPRGERPSRPTASMGMSQEQWEHFKTKWTRYKSLSKLREEDIVNNLIECCDDDLQLSLDRTVGSRISSLNEKNLLSKIKTFAVKAENTLVSRHIMSDMRQSQDEDVIHFASRLQGQAKSCNYNVHCGDCDKLVSYSSQAIVDQLFRGLLDQEIQQEVFARYSSNRALDEMITFISNREAGKRCQSHLSSGVSNSKISPYQRSKMTYRNETNNASQTAATRSRSGWTHDDRPCGWCGKVGHGGRATTEVRKKLCPAFGKNCTNCSKMGHFSSVCRGTKNVGNNYLEPRDVETESEECIILSGIGLSLIHI